MLDLEREKAVLEQPTPKRKMTLPDLFFIQQATKDVLSVPFVKTRLPFPPLLFTCDTENTFVFTHFKIPMKRDSQPNYVELDLLDSEWRVYAYPNTHCADSEAVKRMLNGKSTAWHNDSKEGGIVYRWINEPERLAIPDPNVLEGGVSFIPSIIIPPPFLTSYEVAREYWRIVAHNIGHTIEMKRYPWTKGECYAFRSKVALQRYKEELMALTDGYDLIEIYHQRWPGNLPRAFLGEAYAYAFENLAAFSIYEPRYQTIPYPGFISALRMRIWQDADQRKREKGFAPERSSYGIMVADRVAQACTPDNLLPLQIFLELIEDVLGK